MLAFFCQTPLLTTERRFRMTANLVLHPYGRPTRVSSANSRHTHEHIMPEPPSDFLPMSQPSQVPVVNPDPRRADAQSPDSPIGEETLDRLDQLMSMLFEEEEMGPAQARELNTLLSQDPAARKRYLDTTLLHSDLIEHYRTQARAE